MHLADAFIQSDLQYIQAIHLLSVCVFPGNRTHNLRAANAMLYPLSHRCIYIYIYIEREIIFISVIILVIVCFKIYFFYIYYISVFFI